MPRSKLAAALAATAFAASIVLANWLTTTYGFVPVGFGLTATAGTFAAGLVLAFRDVLQDTAGRAVVLGLVLLGGALSYLVADPRIAVASASAFLVSELLDWAVYTPLRRRSWYGAVAASNAVGAAADTAVFLGLLGVPIWAAMPGQLVGKAWATGAFLLVAWAWRTGRRPCST